jgi:transcriptional regulator with XRE-family HTH domain
MRRVAKGMPQSQLAKGLGVTFQQVQKYERGVNRIGAGRLARIAQILEVPVSVLLEGTISEAGKPGEQSRAALIADRRSLRLAQAFDTIADPVFRLSIVELVERLAALPQPPRGRPGRKRRRR